MIVISGGPKIIFTLGLRIYTAIRIKAIPNASNLRILRRIHYTIIADIILANPDIACHIASIIEIIPTRGRAIRSCSDIMPTSVPTTLTVVIPIALAIVLPAFYALPVVGDPLAVLVHIVVANPGGNCHGAVVLEEIPAALVAADPLVGDLHAGSGIKVVPVSTDLLPAGSEGAVAVVVAIAHPLGLLFQTSCHIISCSHRRALFHISFHLVG